jgi:uncharacterized SAM-binding protein YcdF (DUF218 family)
MSTVSENRPPRRALGAKAILLHALRVTTVFCLAIVAGFFVFAYSISVMGEGVLRSADGIVALTGDEDRISEAVRLLAEGKAKRLLISGVNKSTGRPELINLNSSSWYDDLLFRCCVDLDKRSVNTESNAIETTAWARRQGFHSLIVVTSTYHMPRTLIELRQAMPDVNIVPYPVKSPRLDEQWWRDPRTAWVLTKEYLKFITAFARYGANSVLGGEVKAERPSHTINARVN